MKQQILVGAAAVLTFAAFVPATVLARGFGGYHGSVRGPLQRQPSGKLQREPL